MERVVVEVKLQGEAQTRDMEVAPDVPATQLANVIAAALGWAGDNTGESMLYQIEATPPGRVLRPDETLAQAQAWDGTRLVFLRQDVDTAPVRAPGFAWKQLS